MANSTSPASAANAVDVVVVAVGLIKVDYVCNVNDIYAAGGHGFGLRKSNLPCSTWPERCASWFRQQGMLEKTNH